MSGSEGYDVVEERKGDLVHLLAPTGPGDLRPLDRAPLVNPHRYADLSFGFGRPPGNALALMNCCYLLPDSGSRATS